MKFNVNDRVYYTSNVHTLGPDNPLKGSKYECIGTIDRIDRYGDPSVHVIWDNGQANIYTKEDLELYIEEISIESRKKGSKNSITLL